MTERVISSPAGLSWQNIRAQAMCAVEARLARLARNMPHELLSAEPQLLPGNGDDLEVWTDRSRAWSNHRFFAVDADLEPNRPENRHDLKLTRSRGRRVWLGVPEETHTSLSDARKVRVICVSDLEIRLKQALLRALLNSSRGDLLEQLWNPQPPDPPPTCEGKAAKPLNREQLLALSAMTSEGASFVWGPPGTGKTTAIIQAVVDALEHDRTVLIASHTHVAVDNVLEGLLDSALANGPCSKPGVVIRLASAQSLEKVSPVVREHRFLMRDAAAADLTNKSARQTAIGKRREENRSHGARQQLQEIIEDLDGVDVSLIEDARIAAGAYEEMSCLQPAIASREEQLTELQDQLAKHRETAATGAANEAYAAEAEAALARINREVEDAGTTVLHAENRMRCARGHLATLEHRLTHARASSKRNTSRALWPVLAWRHRQVSKLEAHHAQTRGQLLSAQEFHQQWVQARNAWLSSRTICEELMQELVVSRELAERELRTAREVEHEQNRLRSLQEIDTARLVHLQSATATITQACANELVQDAERQDVFAKLERREQLNEQVAELDAQADALDREQASLNQEVAQRRALLLEQTPVVACTVAALASTPALLSRRFDVVILDEVASIEPAYVTLAGSKADRTLALVGDFLQNAPVAEVDDVEDQEDCELADWQRRDFFHLAGIHDRASAESHPRCVVLRTQHRFPPIIAQTVNGFCYDGLLESAGTRDSASEPTITLIDTSRHADRHMQPEQDSWWNQLGLDLLVAITRRCGDHTDSTGFVCPYRPQAYRAQRLSQREGLPAQCGTAHTLQGREFQTVIVDLMQDDEPRWVSAADLNGCERDKAAAKLLNVALTRAKSKLYLIGNWDFIRYHDSPGMRSLTTLNGHPSFEIIDAADYLASKQMQRNRPRVFEALPAPHRRALVGR